MCDMYGYIYIYIYREREREPEVFYLYFKNRVNKIILTKQATKKNKIAI